MSGGKYIDPYGFSKGGKSKGSSSSSGSGYLDPYGFAPASKSAKPEHHGGGGIGGFFGSVGHFIGSKASLAGHDIAQMPGGTYHLLKPLPVQVYDVARYGPRDLWGGKKGEHALEANQRDAEQQTTGLIKSTKSTLEHPLRDPFATALTVSPALHLPFRGAEIARGVDITEPRTLRMGKAEVPLPPASGHAMVRAGQRAYADVLQHGLDTNPEGRIAAHAAKRIGGSLHETARYRARMREVPAGLLEHAGRELRGAIGKRIPFTHARAAEAALRLTSENSTADEAAAFHRSQAVAGVNPKVNHRLAGLYEHIGKNGMLRQDEHGNVHVNAEKFPKLAEADAALAHAQRDAERIVHEHGLMSEEGQRARIDAPAAIRAGRGDVAAAQARLAELDHAYENLLHSIVPEVSPYGGTLSRAEQLRRNFENSRAGKGKYRALKRQSTVKDEELGLAEDRLHGLFESHPHEPVVQAARSMFEERAQLQDYLNRHGEASMFGESEPGVHGTPREGRGYVPFKIAEARMPRSPIARSGSTVVGKAKSPIGAQSFTGQGLEHGLVPDNTTGLVARHLRSLYRYVNTDEFRRNVLDTGSATRRSARDILVRLPDRPAGKIPLAIERDLGRKNITLDELEGHRQALADHIRELVPGYNPDALKPAERFKDAHSEAARYGVGEKAPKGYAWVDKNALGDLGNAFSFSRGSAGRFADNVNSAVTLATVYLKPGHLPQRTLTNATTVAFQTSLNPLALKDAVTLWRQLNHEDRLRALGAAGQGGYEAMPHDGTGFIGRQATKGANWWAHHVDAPFRFANIAYEARRAGYRTAPAFRRFLHILEQPDRFPKDEALRADAIAKEANRAGIAYDRMSDAERRTVGRVVWFYPWLRNSTLYTGRALVTHPYKASIMAQAGVEGRQHQSNILGDLPSYEQGLLPVGGGKVSDPGRLFPFSTAADVLQLPEHISGARGNLNPAYGALVDLLTGTNSFGGPTKSPAETALQDLLAPAPESQIVTGYLHRHQDQSRRMFPNSGHLHGIEDPLLRALFGAWLPRHFNKPAANSAAAREAKGTR
ncbi:MAG: hypothetical protein ACJ752_00590 [Gaiellaceae bacterium]